MTGLPATAPAALPAAAPAAADADCGSTCARVGLTALLLALVYASLVAVFAACLALVGGEAFAQGNVLIPPPKFDTVFPDPPPPPPNDRKLLEVDVGPVTPGTRYAIDTSSVLLTDRMIARFALVTTSSSGVRNVTYEAIRCDNVERKLLAIGQPDGSWSPLRDPKWLQIGLSGATNPALKPLFMAICSGGGLATNVQNSLTDMARGAAARTPGVAPAP